MKKTKSFPRYPTIGPVANWRRYQYSWSDTGTLIHGTEHRFKFQNTQYRLRFIEEQEDMRFAVERELLQQIEKVYQEHGFNITLDYTFDYLDESLAISG